MNFCCMLCGMMMLDFKMILVPMMNVKPFMWRWKSNLKHDDDDDFVNLMFHRRGVRIGRMSIFRSGDILSLSSYRWSPIPITTDYNLEASYLNCFYDIFMWSIFHFLYSTISFLNWNYPLKHHWRASLDKET